MTEDRKPKQKHYVKSGVVAIPILEFAGGPHGRFWKTGSPFKEYSPGKFTGTLNATETVHAEEAYRLARERIRELREGQKKARTETHPGDTNSNNNHAIIIPATR